VLNESSAAGLGAANFGADGGDDDSAAISAAASAVEAVLWLSIRFLAWRFLGDPCPSC
jgi:hypothetical protein